MVAPRPRRQPQAMSQAVIRLLDPWGGKGAKWPDINAAPSSTLQIFSRKIVTPNASGYAAFRFVPGSIAAQLLVSPTLDATGAVTNWQTGTAIAGYTNVNTNYASYRVVSAGLQFTYIGNNFNNSGLVYALESASESPLGAATVPNSKDDLVMIRHEQRYDKGFRWVARRLSIEAEHYNPPNFTPTDEWTMLTVFLSGCDTSAVQSAEIQTVVNLELIPMSNTITSQTTTPAANDNGLLRSAVHNASAKMPTFFR